MAKSRIEKLEEEILELKIKMAEMKGEMKVLREYRPYRGYHWAQPYWGTGTTPLEGLPQILCGGTTTEAGITNINTSNDDTFSITSDSATAGDNPLWGAPYRHGC